MEDLRGFLAEERAQEFPHFVLSLDGINVLILRNPYCREGRKEDGEKEEMCGRKSGWREMA
jgi:hypothetical protein